MLSKKKRRKINLKLNLKKKVIAFVGIVNIINSFNNTIINVTNVNGNTLFWSSSGTCGFKGTRKSTPYAAQLVAQNIIKKCFEFNIKNIEIIIKGQGSGRDIILRTFDCPDLKILSLEEKTPVVFNGCRPPKKRKL
jgi:small subunit ribosomal protein S11